MNELAELARQTTRAADALSGWARASGWATEAVKSLLPHDDRYHECVGGVCSLSPDYCEGGVCNAHPYSYERGIPDSPYHFTDGLSLSNRHDYGPSPWRCRYCGSSHGADTLRCSGCGAYRQDETWHSLARACNYCGCLAPHNVAVCSGCDFVFSLSA